jgi:predicted GNAT family N-acyltransferase
LAKRPGDYVLSGSWKITYEDKVIGIDLDKGAFHLVAMDRHGKVVAKMRMSRSQMMVYVARIPA